MAVRSATGGEIVEVQGGHIVRSTGRKDRHSKVCTAKGPRDRRVRLSAHTAIKFYDVQDRLGYDRPSKAVDWLINNAKPAIDELDELPPWQPTNSSHPAHAHQVFDTGAESENQPNTQNQQLGQSGSGKKPVESEQFQLPPPFHGNSSFLPPSLDSDAIADTIKSFFPMPPCSSSSPSIHFHNQDLRLSLHPFHDPILPHHQHHHQPTPSGEQALFTGSAPMAFDAGSASWSEQQQQEMGRVQRMIAWNAAESGSGGGGGGGGGYVFSAASPVPLQPLLGQNAFFTQRGPLQSSNSPAVRSWTDLLPIAADHQMTPTFFHPSASSISAIGYASGGFSGFRIPARIQGEEEQDAVGNKPPTSASSAPRH